MLPLDERLNSLRVPMEQAKSSRGPAQIPDWWRKLSKAQRNEYLSRHPRSKFRGVEVTEVISALKPEQKKKLKKVLRHLTGPDGTLTKVVNKKLDPSKIKSKDKEKIATLLKAAFGDADAQKKVDSEGDRIKKIKKSPAQVMKELEEWLGRKPEVDEDLKKLRARMERDIDSGKFIPKGSKPQDGSAPEPETENKPRRRGNGRKAHATRKDRERRQRYGFRAIALTLAASGLMVAGSAALLALGVPIDFFTPDLVSYVWRNVHDMHEPIRNEDIDTLVSNLANAIKKRFAEGVSDKELEDSMMKGSTK